MYESHKNIDLPERDLTIWRYLDLWKFLDIIENKRLHLSQTDILEDKYEGTVPNQTVQLKSLNSHSKKYLKQNIYISCWTASNYEDYALWRIFTDYRTAVAIKSTVNKLIESVSENKSIQRIGIVRYIDHTDRYKPQDNYYQFFFEKRNFFSYEREIRLLTDKIEGIYDEFLEKYNGLYINIKPEILIDEICLAPMSNQSLKNQIELKLKSIGLDVPVRFSNI